MKNHAEYEIVSVSSQQIRIKDMDRGKISVTNDAEWVVQQLLTSFGPREIVYQDSDGEWGKLLHDGVTFTGYGHLSDKSDDS